MDQTDDLLNGIAEECRAKIAVAYDMALSVLSRDERLPALSQTARITMIRAMLKEATAFGFDRDRLVLAAIAVIRSGDHADHR